MYPHERSLVKRLAEKPFVLLGVNSANDRDDVKKIIVKNELTWRSWWNGGDHEGPISAAYDVRHWPTTFVIDHKGIIRYIDVRDKALDDAIEKLLAEIGKKNNDQ
jgi:peroxiredoxin